MLKIILWLGAEEFYAPSQIWYNLTCQMCMAGHQLFGIQHKISQIQIMHLSGLNWIGQDAAVFQTLGLPQDQGCLRLLLIHNWLLALTQTTPALGGDRVAGDRWLSASAVSALGLGHMQYPQFNVAYKPATKNILHCIIYCMWNIIGLPFYGTINWLNVWYAEFMAWLTL